jgi:hypothetical protein
MGKRLIAIFMSQLFLYASILRVFLVIHISASALSKGCQYHLHSINQAGMGEDVESEA